MTGWIILDDLAKECSRCYSSCRLLKCSACPHAVFFGYLAFRSDNDRLQGRERWKLSRESRIEWNREEELSGTDVKFTDSVSVNGRNNWARAQICLSLNLYTSFIKLSYFQWNILLVINIQLLFFYFSVDNAYYHREKL